MLPTEYAITAPDGTLTQFGYDAVKNKNKRRAPTRIIKSEDKELDKKDREKLIGTTHEVHRNYSVIAWAIRRHLDYVSSFKFQSKNRIGDLDDRIEMLMKRWGRNCDVSKRHPLRRLTRLIEELRVMDGDAFVYKLADGRIQVIESDNVDLAQDGLPDNYARNQNKPNDEKDEFIHGVKLDKDGAPVQYALCERNKNGTRKVHKGFIRAEHVIHVGYFDRINQVRGISPLASAINTFQDTYEGFDYMLQKMKISQLFGLVFYRDADESPGQVTDGGDGAGDGYSVDFGEGPQMLDLEPGDKAEFLESKSPASETQAFMQLMIQVGLKALDIPYSFFDESHTNFYGSRGGLMQYLKSCDEKRAQLADLLDELTLWRLRLFVEDGDLILPDGMTVDDLKWEWIPDGVPWWDPAKEVRGHVMAIAAGLDTPQRVCRATGTDYYENIDAIREANEYAQSQGVRVVYTGTGLEAGDVPEEAGTEDES